MDKFMNADADDKFYAWNIKDLDLEEKIKVSDNNHFYVPSIKNTIHKNKYDYTELLDPKSGLINRIKSNQYVGQENVMLIP